MEYHQEILTNNGGSSKYKESQILTASKPKLLLMLFDSLIGYCEDAKKFIDDNNIEMMHINLIKAQKIVLEFKIALDPRMDTKIYKNLQSLYTFIYTRLVEANMSRSIKAINEALGIIKTLRDAFEENIRLTCENHLEKTTCKNSAAQSAVVDIKQ